MKKSLTFTALCALALCACGGGNSTQTQSNAPQQQAGTAAVNVQNETPAPAATADKDIAKAVFKKLYPDIQEVYADNDYSCYGSAESDAEGCDGGARVYVAPMNDGGYFVLDISYFVGPGCSPAYEFGSWVYKNGSLDTVQNILPFPKFDDLLNPNKTAGFDVQITSCRDMYNHKPVLSLYYSFISRDSLEVSLYPYDCDEVFYEADKYMLCYENKDQLPIYKWDGQKFVLVVKGSPAAAKGSDKFEELKTIFRQYHVETDFPLAEQYEYTRQDNSYVIEGLSSKGASCFSVVFFPDGNGGYCVYFINYAEKGYTIDRCHYTKGEFHDKNLEDDLAAALEGVSDTHGTIHVSGDQIAIYKDEKEYKFVFAFSNLKEYILEK